MFVRIIQPSHLDEQGTPIRYQKLFMPFLTTATLAGLTPSGVDVGITDDFVEDIDYDEPADLVAITAQTAQAPRAYQIADEFRRRGRRVVLGGIHASLCTDEARQHADSIVVGEAEDIWKEVVGDAHEGQLKPFYQAEQKPDLSQLVIPRFDLLDYSHYVIPPFARTPLLPIQTTRGCPYDCDFCSVVTYLGRKMRKKPVAHVIREIEFARPSRIIFTDDNIAGDVEHARELFRALKPLKLRWACQMSTRIMDHPDLIELAAEAGCHETLIGVETLNARALQGVGKKHNRTNEYTRLFRMLKDVGILAQVSLIYGFDEDTAEDLLHTIDQVQALDVNYVYIFVLTPFPATRVNDRMREQHRVRTDNWSLYDGTHVVIDLAHMTSGQLFDAMWKSYEQFYSMGNILKRMWKFGREYVKYFPRDSAVEEFFFQLHMRRASRNRLHPFSLGFRRNGSS